MARCDNLSAVGESIHARAFELPDIHEPTLTQFVHHVMNGWIGRPESAGDPVKMRPVEQIRRLCIQPKTALSEPVPP